MDVYSVVDLIGKEIEQPPVESVPRLVALFLPPNCNRK